MNIEYAATGQKYWALSPCYFGNFNAFVRYVDALGSNNNRNAYYSYGARPVVSLRPDAEITGGSGTYDSPYKIG